MLEAFFDNFRNVQHGSVKLSQCQKSFARHFIGPDWKSRAARSCRHHTKPPHIVMKVFVIVTGASSGVGRAFGRALCDESMGLTHLRALLVDDHLKALESTGVSMKQNALACKVLLSMYQMDVYDDLKGLDSRMDDLLVEVGNQVWFMGSMVLTSYVWA